MFPQGASGSGVDMRTIEASKDMGDDEATFNVPVPLGQKVSTTGYFSDIVQFRFRYLFLVVYLLTSTFEICF